MSRTDKTKPFWVKLMHGDLATEEQHNHTDGTCDLPPIEDATAFTYCTTQCRRAFVFTGTRVCCCKLCQDHGWDIRPGKRQRLESRRKCRDWERDY
ncbi:hypothetical protein [Mycolicibacterium fortuitum]|uniref:Uncharacterized protein n=2 Tax=Mycolicibacterium fortuitum TaxID=1766 RepID=A0AAE5AF82_MYCFO|nr:hypothetical protein [Mycolicibacterium fortuitum]MCV7142879.1 hypothetical protein [Mycolicibacterium fortuitum]MDV7190604.1 hypothetical protein [Mycolicibacterium fortuitum]MDV7207917.1 hypothetical protein [Mycolicibacterium fortuitum]MDV7229868.1 hypothetical protein [Mycolicibacterium fortuitum]MDV7257795.1 hypothetical protein [Mycolicibacterium fortuitum]